MKMKLRRRTLAVLGVVGISLVACGESNGNDGAMATAGATTSGAGAASVGGSMTSSSAGNTSAPGSSGSAGATITSAGQGGSSSGGSSALAGAATMGGRYDPGGNGPGGSAGAAGGNSNPGTCSASKATGANASGSGTHKVTIETNPDAGIKEGTIFRPADLGGAEKYPIFVWGEGGCAQDGMNTSAAMAEIASHGYFVVADGTVPKNSQNRPLTNDIAGMAQPLLAYVSWAIAENQKPCSAYYGSLDATKIASNGFSCGGLMAEGTAGDARMTTWGLNSSGLMSANAAFYKTIHTPVLMVLGGPSDIAYENGMRDYDNISAAGIPILLFSKDIGHGGDLFSARGGDFTKINLAWLNWQLKGDVGATGKGMLVGAGCNYCSGGAWEMKTKNIQ